MLTTYIHAAMGKTKYEILKDDGSYYGEIPGFRGIYSNASSLERCREELEEVLEEWILFRISKYLPVPSIGRLRLKIKQVA
ncbi:MAG: type II toxin-antitoxin system HicB family antitoxin [Bacteroidota bacterium]